MDLQRAVDDYNVVVGTLERRVLVTARRMADLGVVDGELESAEVVESVPRPMTAAELLTGWDDVSAATSAADTSAVTSAADISPAWTGGPGRL